ncbi:MAG TPA: FAD-dependent oxidoreductase [Methylomirabilota bacterium]|nr:FAD-dependent oxidoreductase [Methylomirabilota bacterium]
MAKPSALVIGGGVIGVAAAYYLARGGWDVTIVETGEICAGSSYGNGGLVVPSHSIPLAAPGVWLKGLKWMLNPESPFYIKPRLSPELLSWLWQFRAACTPARAARAMPVLRDLSFASLALFRELAAIPGFEFGFRQEGALAVFRTEKAYEAALADARFLGEGGIPTKVLDGVAARALEPALAPGVVGAIFFPDDALLIPDVFVRGLAALAEQLGVRIRTGTEVLGFLTRGARITTVETTRGNLPAGEAVVLAAGSWSPRLAAAAGLRLPIQPAKGYSVTYRRPPDGLRIPLLLGEAKAGVTPMGDMLRYAGTLELAGLDLSINRRRVNAIIRSAAPYLRGAESLELLEIWRGLRPCTPDGLPVIGRPKRIENLILATGHAMIGVSLGPITGKLVAQLASGEPTAVDVGALTPERFA